MIGLNLMKIENYWILKLKIIGFLLQYIYRINKISTKDK